MERNEINASVGVGPFRFYTSFSFVAVLIGLLIGCAVLAFGWVQYKLSPYDDLPRYTPSPTISTPASPLP